MIPKELVKVTPADSPQIGFKSVKSTRNGLHSVANRLNLVGHHAMKIVGSKDE
jgi:hypothetical protein